MRPPKSTLATLTTLALSLLLQGCFLSSSVTDLNVKQDGSNEFIGDPAFSNNPTSLFISGITFQSLQLTWTAPAQSFDNYKLAYLQATTPPANCSLGTVITLSKNLTTYNVVSLLSDTSYSFRLCSLKNDSTVSISEGSFVTGKTLISPPNNPLGFSGVASSISQIDFTWTSGGGTTIDYRISYQAGATAPAACTSGTVIPESLISGTNHSVTGLTANTQYSFRLCAINGNLTPDESSGVTATVTTLQAPAPNPTGLSATPNSDTQITLSWTSGGGSTSGYIIAYQAGTTDPANCSSGTVISSGNITGTSHAVTGLTASTAYRFRVCAINSSSAASSGVTVAGTTLATPQAPPPNPTGFAHSTLSSGSATLTWTSGGGTTADYRISYQTGATAPATCAAGTTVSETAISGTSHSISGLSANTQYSFRLCAINGNATPDVSSGVTHTATTLYATPPNVTGLTATPNSDTQITLSWSSGGGSTSGYRISYAAGASAPANCASGLQVGEGSITGTSHALTSLTATTQYSFRVCAINSNGTPDVSSGTTATATTLQAAPPNPTGLTILPGALDSEMKLAWTSGGGSTIDYRISYQASATAPASCAAGTTISESAISGTNHTVTGLTGGAQYSFRVCAINGNSTPSVSSGVTATATTKKLATALRSIFTSEAPTGNLTFTYVSREIRNNKVIVKDDSVYKILNVTTGTLTNLSLPGMTEEPNQIIDASNYTFSGTNNYAIYAVSGPTISYLYAYNIDTDTYASISPAAGGYAWSSGVDFAHFDGYFYVVGWSGGSTHIYRTNGTAAGTTSVFSTNNDINLLEAAGSYLYVSYDHTANASKELHRLNAGSTPTLTLVKDLCGFGNCHGLTSNDFAEGWSRGAMGTNFYFIGYDGTTERLYKTDGTSAGTIALTVAGSDQTNGYVDIGGILLFKNGNETWRTDGSVPGTFVLNTDIKFSKNGFLYAGYYYWAAGATSGDYELWKTDGTVANTTRIDTIEAAMVSHDAKINGVFFSASTVYFPYVIIGTDLIYIARKALGVELYKVPLAGGTPVLIKDINTGSDDGVTTVIPGQQSSLMTMVSATEFVFAGNENNDIELWISDGTGPGTYKLKEINTHAPGSSSPTDFIRHTSGEVYFSAYSANHGREIWKTNGTTVGTVEIADTNPNPVPLETFGIVPTYGFKDWTTKKTNWAMINNKLMSLYTDPFRGMELFQLDTVSETFTLLKELVPGPVGSNSAETNQDAFWGGNFFFPAGPSNHIHVMATDGTDPGTVDALGGLSEWFFNIVLPRGTVGTSKVLIPPTNTFDPNVEFYVFDTVAKTTSTITNLCANDCARMVPGPIANVSSTLSIYMDYEGNLWKTDGTSGGTALANLGLTDILLPVGLPVSGDKYLLFGGKAGVGFGVWSTDGTGAGTNLILLINSSYTLGDGSLYGYSFIQSVNSVYYIAVNETGVKSELYKTDGTAANTSLVKAFNPITQTILKLVGIEQGTTAKFFVQTGDYQLLYTDSIYLLNPTDGVLATVENNTAVEFGFSITPFQIDGLVMYQTYDVGGNAYKDIKSIRASDNNISTILTTTLKSDRLCAKGGRVYFTYDDGISGNEIWYSNGSADGTDLWDDTNPGGDGSEFGIGYELNNKCFFWGKTGANEKSKIYILDF